MEELEALLGAIPATEQAKPEEKKEQPVAKTEGTGATDAKKKKKKDKKKKATEQVEEKKEEEQKGELTAE